MPETVGIYYSESANGLPERPLLLLHGAGSSHLMWPPLMRRLPGCTILALDLPGHGKSRGRSCNSIDHYAEILLDFLAEKRIYQAALVGHSMGGAVALQVALKQPQLVCGLGLISTGAHFDLPPALSENFHHNFARENALHTFEGLSFSAHTPPPEREKMMRLLRLVHWNVLENDWQACAGFDARVFITRMDMPAWVAVGAEDRLTPLPQAQFLTAHLPHARLQLVPRAGHFLPLEQPAALSVGFQGFVARLASERGKLPHQPSGGISAQNDRQQNGKK